MTQTAAIRSSSSPSSSRRHGSRPPVAVRSVPLSGYETPQLAARDVLPLARYDPAVTQRQSLAILLAQTVVAVAVLTAATVLAALDKIDGAAVTAIYGAAIGLVGPATVTLGSAMINGGPKPDFAQIARSSPEAAVALAAHANPNPPSSSEAPA